MVWHILAIVFGALAAGGAYFCPSPWSGVVLGVLVVVFASLALERFRKARK